MAMQLQDLLAFCADQQASDLHLTTNEPPVLRIHGRLVRTDLAPLDQQDLTQAIYDLLTAAQEELFEAELELDFSHEVPGVARFRVNVHRQRGAVEAAFRLIPSDVPSVEQLGLPNTVSQLARRPNGLVLVTGPTGMGKTTTLAAMVDLINRERECLILTIEDPIEFVFTNGKSVIKQREVHTDTRSFAQALKHALRQDPNVIVVGEMRDLETIRTALTAAETGHLVLATLHTPDAPQTVARIVDVFPPHQQPQVRLQLSECLQGIVSQLLLPRASGQGRALAMEILVATPGIRNMIREQQTEQILTALQTGGKLGMRTMDRSLQELLRDGQITRETALSKARSPEDFGTQPAGKGSA